MPTPLLVTSIDAVVGAATRPAAATVGKHGPGAHPGRAPGGRRSLLAPLALLVALLGHATCLSAQAQADAQAMAQADAQAKARAEAQALAIELHRATAEVALASIAIRDAWGGNANAFEQLRARCSAAAATPERLAAAVSRGAEPRQVAMLRAKLEFPLRSWSEDCGGIADARASVLAAHETRQRLEAAAPRISLMLDEVALRLRDEGGSALQVYVVMRQLVVLNRLGAHIGMLFDAGPDAIHAQDRVKRDTMVFARSLDALIERDPDLDIPAIENADSVAELRAAREQFGPIADQLLVLSDDQVLMDTSERIADLTEARDALVEDLRSLAAEVSGAGQ